MIPESGSVMDIAIGTLVIFGVVMLAMAIGTLLTGRPLKGSCGGVGAACPCSDAEKQACTRRAH